MAKKTKKLVKQIKLQIPAGKANPAPPVGPALGAAGINIMDFCKQFNAKTQDKSGEVLPVVIYLYSDKSFTFETKEPPMSRLILSELKLESGSGEPNKNKVASLNDEQVEKIAERKMPDLNVIKADKDQAMKSAKQIVIGTARSMGIDYNKGK